MKTYPLGEGTTANNNIEQVGGVAIPVVGGTPSTPVALYNSEGLVEALGGGGSVGGAGVIVGYDVGDFTFDASAKTVTFSGLGTVMLRQVLQIANLTDGVIIFDPSTASKGGTMLSNVLTLEYDTTSMDDADTLRIYLQYNNSEDYTTNSKKVTVGNQKWTKSTDPEPLILATPYELTASFADICSEIPIGDANSMTFWFNIDIGLSTDVQLRFLHRHTSAGNNYREMYLGNPGSVTTINLNDYQVATNDDQLFKITIPVTGTRYLMIQAKDAANGDGQIDSLYITKDIE